MATTPGRRVYLDEHGHLKLAPGDYGKDTDGVWKARAPRLSSGDLRNHEVTEHEDGTITVSPSILIEQPPIGTWHGYLERGVWREC